MKVKRYIKLLIVLMLYSSTPAIAGFTVGHGDTSLSAIPNSWISEAKATLHIAYNHTSHGNQIITGINALRDFPAFNGRYNWIDSSTGNTSSLSLADSGIPGIADLSQGDYVADGDSDGIAIWARDTHTFLINPSNYHINVIMWSWCDIGGHDIDLYLESMEWLISLFGKGGSHERAALHPVDFIFMTGHANGGGEGDSSDSANTQIRQHCRVHDRILFDFSDIENYDPDNNYFLDKHVDDALYYDASPPYTSSGRNANWASRYLDRHAGSELDFLVNGSGAYPGCESCAHSPDDSETADARLNCILKGRAAWHLMARLAGWVPGGEPPPPPPVGGDGFSPAQIMLLLMRNPR